MPLAHILAPQLARKAEEIAQATGDGSPSYLRSQQDPRVGVFLDAFNQSKMPPASPAQAAEQSRQFYPPGDARYIPADAVPTPAQKATALPPASVVGQQNIGDKRTLPEVADGWNKSKFDPKGLMNKKAIKAFDPRTPVGSYLAAMGEMQRSKDPEQQAVARAMAEQLDAPDRERAGKVTRPIPNFVPPDAPSILGPQPQKHTVRGRQVITLEPDANGAVAYDEAGRGVDARGRKILDESGRPMMPPQPAGMSYLNRTDRNVDLDPKDAFGAGVLQRRYGKHLKEMEDNRDERGMPTDKFPDGYFDKMTKAERKDIEDGVKALQRMRKETGTFNGAFFRKGPMI